MIWHQRPIEANVFQKDIPHIQAFRCFTILQGCLSLLIYLPQSSLLYIRQTDYNGDCQSVFCLFVAGGQQAMHRLFDVI